MGFLENLFGDNTPPVFKLVKTGDIDGLRRYGKFDINQVYDCYPLINYAIANTKVNLYSIVEFLIKSGCDVNAHDHYTAVGYAPIISMGSHKYADLNVAKLLLDNGARVNSRSKAGASALTGTVFTRRLDMLDLLHNYHANFNLPDWEGNTVFHQLVTYYRQQYFEFTPANINEINTYVSRLIKYGARLDIANKAGIKPLDIPAYGIEKIVKMKNILSKFI
jgi:ankyrin repeat protein